jgi:8-oxo-dGTP pyrophosphatase MutT (NUDIX family)
MYKKIKNTIITIGYIAYRTIRKPILWYYKIIQKQTRGVRVLLTSGSKLILVRHWYHPLWVLPGGGVHAHESPEEAAVREIKEELDITIDQLDYLLGIYNNNRGGKQDVVHCFVKEFDSVCDIPDKKFNFEISDRAWFDFDALPTPISHATLLRIKEYKTQAVSKDIRSWD